MTALSTLLADTSRSIAYVVELAERDPDTDTETTRYYQTPNREAPDRHPALLSDPGGRNDRLQVDELESIAAQAVEPIKLVNQPAAVGAAGPLDFLRGRSLAGRSITIYAGASEESFANYEPVVSGVVDREPVFEGNIVEIRIKSPLERLNVDLDVGNYVGEPGALRFLTSTGKASAANNAAHHLASFTVAGRFKTSGVASAASIVRRIASATSQNWNVFMNAAGLITARYTSGGTAVNLTGTTARNDGRWHWFAFARKGGHRYLMIDGLVVVESTSGGTPDLPVAGVAFNPDGGFTGFLCDHRVYRHYIAPDEIGAAMAVRASGGETGVVGLWRGDDQTGTNFTDYSSTAAHATVSGTEGVDFEWVSSDLGTAELAGRSMPVLIGSVWNAPADLVDPVRERWRVSDRIVADTWVSKKVRDEGEELSSSTDYSWTDGEPVLELVAEAGEPVTAGIDEGVTSRVGHVLGVSPFAASGTGSLLIDRGPLSSSTLDLTPLESQYPNTLGIAVRRRRVYDVLREVLEGCLGHAYARADGTVVLDALVAPLAPGPRDGACNSIASTEQDLGRIAWSAPAGTLSGKSFTLACWVKLLRTSPTDLGAGAINLVDLRTNGSNTPAVTLEFNPNRGISSFELTSWGPIGFLSRASMPYSGFSASPEWVFVAVVHDDPANVTRFYAAPSGGSLALLGTTTGLALSGAPGANGVVIGGSTQYDFFRGSVSEPQAWNATLSLAQLQALMTAAPAGNEVNLAFYAPLNGASLAALTDTVSGATGTTAGHVREVPDLTLDLRLDPAPFRVRSYRPAKFIRVGYRPNDAVLDPANIAATVSQAAALDLLNTGRFELWQSGDIEADYEDALEVELSSRWYTLTGALATLRVARHRYAPARQLAEIEGAPREALILEIGDELRVYGSRWGLDAGPVYRVIANHARLGDLTCDLGLWR